MDCVDNINGAGDEAAAKALAEDVVSNLSKEPPEGMVLYGHSQGGLINKEAIAQADGVLFDLKYDKFKSAGMLPAAARAAARADVNARLGHLEAYIPELEKAHPAGKCC